MYSEDSWSINQEVSRWSKDVKLTYFYDVKIEGVSNELQWVIADGLAPIFILHDWPMFYEFAC